MEINIVDVNFSEWLASELKAREMSQVDLARKSGVTPAQISRILSGQRGAEGKTLRAIAGALKLPPERVFRAAGILPPSVKVDELTEQIIYDAQDLSDRDKEEVLAFIRMKQNLRKKK